jgi:hypothetical protein
MSIFLAFFITSVFIEQLVRVESLFSIIVRAHFYRCLHLKCRIKPFCALVTVIIFILGYLNMTVSERAKYDEDKRLREEEEERAARRLAAQMNLVRPRTAAELRNRYLSLKYFKNKQLGLTLYYFY